jgi:type I restriction enzyme, S subunit
MGKGIQMVPLGELLTPVSRPEPTILEKQYSILGAHWYAYGLYIKDIKLGSEIQADRVYRVEEGDFVYNRLFAWKGSFALALKADHDCYVSNEFPCFRVKENKIDGQYLWKYFSRSSAWNEALGLSSGGTPTSRNRLKEAKLLKMEIPLPSIEEQQRIVAKIEELAAKIEEARGLRREVEEEAGMMTKVASDYFFSISKHDTKVDRLGNISKRITKGESPEWQGFTYQESGPLFVRSENVLWGKLDLSKRTCIPIEFHMKLNRSQLHPGDVLINLVGASIGRACIVPDGIREANINQAVAVISPDSERLNSRYLMHFLLSASTQSILQSGKVETARPNISLGDLSNLELPILSLTKQSHIVSYLDNLQSKIDSLKQLQSETSAELDALLPSILDKAFKGEL